MARRRKMDDHLGYSKYDYKNKETDDSRNGYFMMIFRWIIVS